MFHAEGSHFPKLRCRISCFTYFSSSFLKNVIGAFFEKIGSKSFAVYSIAVTDAENNTWFVKRRYRNFERLHRHLKDIPNYNLHLPPKRIFSSSTEDKLVHQRCIQLDKYLQDLLSIANVAEQHEVWDFVSASSKNYSFGKSSSVMRTLAVNVDDAVDDIVRQVKGVSDEFMCSVVGSSSSHHEASSYVQYWNLSWNLDDLIRHSSTRSSVETTNSHSHSDDEEGGGENSHAFDEAGSSPEARGWHSDNALHVKDFPPRVVKRVKGSRSSKLGKMPGLKLNPEPKDTGHSASSPVSFGHMEDAEGVPLECTPPNFTVPVLNLVDKIFQLNRRSWIRRQVFWISKQILQLVMEDAIDDFLLSQIHWLRNEDVIDQGIRWVQDVLWPDDKFFLKLEITAGKSDESQHKSSGTASHSTGRKASPPDSFEVQLEATRRANYIRKLLFDGAPTALVSFVGHKQYRRCVRDIYYFLQSPICVNQLAYGGLELILISLFPELRELLMDTLKNMRGQPT